MKFISTRGTAPPSSFSDVLLAGLAPDGGLYLPESWPQLTAAQIAGFKAMRYQDVAFHILSHFTRGSFSDADVTRVMWVNDRRLVFDAFQDGPEIKEGGAGTFAVNVDGGDSRQLISRRHALDSTGRQ